MATLTEKTILMEKILTDVLADLWVLSGAIPELDNQNRPEIVKKAAENLRGLAFLIENGWEDCDYDGNFPNPSKCMAFLAMVEEIREKGEFNN